MAVAGLVLGILAVALCWIMVVNWVLAILGIVFGGVGIAKAGKRGGVGKGMAITGVVLGAVGAVAGVLVLVVAMQAFHAYIGDSKSRLAKTQVEHLAMQAFPEWAMSHPDKACPDRIDELFDVMMTSPDLRVDPWQRPFKMLCGSSLPPGARGIAILSLGEDGVEGTADDVKSW